MPETEVKPNPSGRFTIPGRPNVKANLGVDIDLGSNKPSDYGVVQKDLDTSKLPTAYDGVNINWFNAFGVRQRKSDGTLGGYASILYTVIAPIPSDKRIFVYYGSQIREITRQDTAGAVQNLKYRVENGNTIIGLTAGDPPIGYGP